ncbi:ATP-binding cassette domain-containing protein [Mycoplasma marinum]|uniref:ATP-binding cassette domain-containing protein n=1 Tax=Mycoplasma marinum TaxID=1937190 RepID=UPI003B2D14AE
MNKNNKVVEVSNLNKTFMSKNGVVKAIDDVSFSIRKGEIVGLIGESGSGKTTIGRTLLRLHVPNSGSIKIDGNEYASKKISKKNNRKLRNNAQMIFQDPYSSLNGQKNVLNIVSEPLIVNKTDKKMVKNYLDERRGMLLFFKYTLNSFYWEKEWKDKKESLLKRIEIANKNINDMNSIELNVKDPKVSLYRALINAFYKDKISFNSKLVSKVSDDLEEYLNKWNELKSKLSEEQIDELDEKNLLEAKDNFEKAKEELKGSKKLHLLREKNQELDERILEINDEIESMNDSSISLFDALIEKIKQDNKECKISINLSKTYGEQNFILLTMAKNRIILDKVAKIRDAFSSILLSVNSNELNDKISIITKELYGELFDKYKRESVDLSTPLKKFSDIYEEISSIEWDDNNSFERFIANQAVNDANKLSDMKSVINKINAEKNAIDIEINALMEKDSLRDQEKLQENIANAKKELDNAKEINENEIKKYSKEYILEFAELKAKNEQEINELEFQVKEIEAKAHQFYEAKMEEIKEFETEFLMEENETDVSWKLLNSTIKASLNDKKQKNQALVGEWKRLVNSKKIIRQLYGISKSIRLPYLLRKFLVKMEVFKTLKHAGLQPSHAFRYPHEFSGGMRQRVGIARAIINKPKFIIADEPIAALDLSIQAQVVNMLLEQKERLGLAMLFIAHDLSMVRFNSDRILIMHLGKLVEYGETETIFSNPKHPYTKNLIKTMPSLDNLSQGFKDSTFIADYLKPYSITNKPEYVQVGNEDHFVLADAQQAIEWVGKGAKKATEIENADEYTNNKKQNSKDKKVNTAETSIKAAKNNTSNESSTKEEIITENKIVKIPKKYNATPMQKREKRFGGTKTNRSFASKENTPSKIVKTNKKPKAVVRKEESSTTEQQENISPIAPGRRLKDKYKPVASRRGGKKSLRTKKFTLK